MVAEMPKRKRAQHAQGCTFCHMLRREYAPEWRETRDEAAVDWHRHVLEMHANLQWVSDNEATLRAFIAAHESTEQSGD